MAARPSLLLAENAGFTPAVRAELRGWAEVHEGPLAAGGLAAALRAHDIVWLRLGHRLRAEDIGPGVRCRVLACPATGLDHLDLDACARAGIRIAALRGEVEFLRSVRATAEHTLALVLALLRRVPAAHASVLAGRWDRDAFRGRELHGRTAGVVGLGRLGVIVAGYLRALGMHVLGHDPRPDFPAEAAERRATLAELFAEADIVTLHVAYAPATHHLVNGRVLAAARPGAVLVNTSRGAIVDHTAVLAALASGRLAGAALDVIEGEPGIGPDHPLVQYARAHEHLILTPHIGGNTSESLAKTEAFIAAKTRRLWEEASVGR